MSRRELRDEVRNASGSVEAVWSALVGLRLVEPESRRSYQRQARGFIVRCPAHGERTPSCSVRAMSGGMGCKCMGCGWHGDLFDLVAQVNSLDVRRDFARVVEIAADLVGVHADGSGYTAPERPALPPEPPRLDVETFDSIAGCLDPLEAHPDVLAYAAGRLPGADLSELRALPGDRAGREALVARIVERVGLDAWRASGLNMGPDRDEFAWERHRLVILFRNAAGLIDTVQRRPIVEGVEPKYARTRGRSLRQPFGVDRVAAMGPSTAVAYAEGALDAIALRVITAREGLDWCVLGVPGVENWDAAFALHAAGRVAVVAFDRDEAGDAKAPEVGRDLRRSGASSVQRAKPQGAKDWAEMLQRGARERD